MARRARARLGEAIVSSDVGMAGLLALLVCGAATWWNGGLEPAVADVPAVSWGDELAFATPTTAVHPVIAWVQDGLQVRLESECRYRIGGLPDCPPVPPEREARIGCLGACADGGPDLAALQELLLDARRAYPQGTEATLVPTGRSQMAELMAVMDAVREVDVGEGEVVALFPDVSVVTGR
ncbi:MAG: hypothetical protein H6733_14905 [Alphaproteobacteria bacterium]|nr:hypothetical protein [Alphaproteobacteria bacterium]